ncbi:hypothetical protein [Ectothiorhodospira shaposhnikovii]|uniref:hypothetical protein n=1 Tax=Ectothiorhodospira shaposhnikovii TaxID=1054 RepID=UPI001EE824CC|nr:hypothetical protein [Ectothiorhodospira shaposhnikovii]MCG5512800.1 hypothetical protein [Ectothiorhodospira shaposhnikovii]
MRHGEIFGFKCSIGKNEKWIDSVVAGAYIWLILPRLLFGLIAMPIVRVFFGLAIFSFNILLLVILLLVMPILGLLGRVKLQKVVKAAT